MFPKRIRLVWRSADLGFLRYLLWTFFWILSRICAHESGNHDKENRIKKKTRKQETDGSVSGAIFIPLWADFLPGQNSQNFTESSCKKLFDGFHFILSRNRFGESDRIPQKFTESWTFGFLVIFCLKCSLPDNFTEGNEGNQVSFRGVFDLNFRFLCDLL